MTDMAAELQLRPFSVDEFHQLFEAGILRDDERVELIDGALVEMSPPPSSYAPRSFLRHRDNRRGTDTQPESALSRWFHARTGQGRGRIRRIAIVALARKLIVALWRFLTTGLVPEGAVLRAAV